jgi:hypothetical protein
LRSATRLYITTICFLGASAACDIGIIGPPGGDPLCRWSYRLRGTLLEIAYGCSGEFPQYAAFHTESGFLRLNYGPESGWGTSIIVVPSLWVGGTYYQGAAVVAVPRVEGDDLIVDFSGTIAGIAFSGQLRFPPPGPDSFSCEVTVQTDGNTVLDDRPGEAFKPVMLSSMRVAADMWDASAAVVDSTSYPLPDVGWIVQPPVMAARFSLPGGTSTWKDNAPTIEITLNSPQTITGWVTPSNDPNDDNVGFWAASDSVLPAWHYTAVAQP